MAETLLPVVLIHGYSSEGRDTPATEIYGDLPAQLSKALGAKVVTINLSRWVSLSDGITLDDVSFALNRELNTPAHKALLSSGFHCLVHSTGALVIRHWLQHYSPKPSPVKKVVYLAGALFGSGLSMMGFGQLARWGSIMFRGTQTGMPSLETLEFGSNNTLQLHTHFLQPEEHLLDDYGVYEYCLVGSQTLPIMRLIPNRYMKEDSSDCTVRTASANSNFNYFTLTPKPHAFTLDSQVVSEHIQARLANLPLPDNCYQLKEINNSDHSPSPFCLTYETAHMGEAIGIVSGNKNRTSILPRIKEALLSANTLAARSRLVDNWQQHTQKTLMRCTKLKQSADDWDPKAQYEPHGQLIFRVRDQFGQDVEQLDITFQSPAKARGQEDFAKLIEDKAINPHNSGNVTFYLRTHRYQGCELIDRRATLKPVVIEISGAELHSNRIQFLPVMLKLTREQISMLVKPFCTTLIDVTLLRVPSASVFQMSRALI